MLGYVDDDYRKFKPRHTFSRSQSNEPTESPYIKIEIDVRFSAAIDVCVQLATAGCDQVFFVSPTAENIMQYLLSVYVVKSDF